MNVYVLLGSLCKSLGCTCQLKVISDHCTMPAIPDSLPCGVYILECQIYPNDWIQEKLCLLHHCFKDS